MDFTQPINDMWVFLKDPINREIISYLGAGLIAAIACITTVIAKLRKKPRAGRGGKAIVKNSSGEAYGGDAGRSGKFGPGGDGGDAKVIGKSGKAVGGRGGDG